MVEAFTKEPSQTEQSPHVVLLVKEVSVTVAVDS